MVNNILKINFIVVLVILIPVIGLGQMNSDSIIWPGDVNNNGVVNHIDVLYVGAAYGSQGGTRDTQTIQWNPADVPSNWQMEFQNGFSFAFADCDGNGIINEVDINAINTNYGFEHDILFPDSFPNNGNITDTELFFNTGSNTPVAMPGEFVSIPINLGSDNIPLENFYGLAFSVEVNTEYIDMESVFFEHESTWIDPQGQNLITYQRRDNNTLDVVLSRKTMTTTSGGGTTGVLSFIIEGNVPGFAPDVEALTITDVYVVDEMLNQTYTAGNHSLYLDITNPIKELPKSEFSIYPNPVSKGICTIQGLENYTDAEVRLLDIAGREMKAELIDNRLLVGNLPVGIYFININTPQGILTEKIFIK